MATRVKLVVSHRHNLRTQVKMAQVDGCTFFRRETGWKHVDKSCERNDHWIWMMLLTIGQCVLERVGIAWRHRDKCLAARLYDEMLEVGVAKVRERIEKEMQVPAPADAVMTDDLAKAIEKMNEARTQMLLLVTKVEKEKPSCILDPDDIPLKIGGCEFKRVGDEFYHLGKRCKLHEHRGQAGDRKIHLTRKSGRDINEFVKTANEAIGQVLAMTPPNVHEHVIAEV